MATNKDLPGIPPVPPSDMDPDFCRVVEKRKESAEKSLKAVQEELAVYRNSNGNFLADRRNYLLARERHFLLMLDEIDRVLKKGSVQ